MKTISLFLIFTTYFSSLAVTTSLLTDNVTSLRVSVHVFSGRPDPEWIIHPSNRNFEDILHGVIGHASTPLGAHLGYSGFSIDICKDDVCHRSVVVGKCTRPAFEALLLNAVKVVTPEGSSQPLSDTVLNYIREAIENCPST